MGLTINGGTTITSGVILNCFSGYSPSLTIQSSDFTTGSFSGGGATYGTTGYLSTGPGDLICPFYELTGATGTTATRISDFFTACGYDPSYSYAFNANFSSYTPYLGSLHYVDYGNSYLTVPNSGAFSQDNVSTTVECWVNISLAGNVGYIYNQNTAGFVGLVSYPDGTFGVVQDGQQLIVSPSFPINTWYHIAMCLDYPNGTVNLYVNGVSQGSNYLSNPASSQDVTAIGAFDGTGSYSFFGYIADVRVTRAGTGGTPVYTGDFAVRTAPLTATQLASTNITAITSGQCQLLLDVMSSGGYITDTSGYNVTVTNNNGVSWSTNSPDIAPTAVSNYSGLVRVWWNGSTFKLSVMDPGNTGWQGGNPNLGSGLTGTFVWPLTLTPYTPTTQLSGNNWC